MLGPIQSEFRAIQLLRKGISNVFSMRIDRGADGEVIDTEKGINARGIRAANVVDLIEEAVFTLAHTKA